MQRVRINRADFPVMQEFLTRPVEPTRENLVQLRSESRRLLEWYQSSIEAFRKWRDQRQNVTHVQTITTQIDAARRDQRPEVTPGQLRTVKHDSNPKPPVPKPPPTQRRGDRKGQKVTHGNQRVKAAPGNKKEDFWAFVARCFAHLPSDVEIAHMFSVMNRVPDPGPPRVIAPPHWSVRMTEIAARSAPHRNSLLMPPGPPPAHDAIGDFWKEEAVSFQIEDVQRCNSSVLHCLLNALVEIDEPVEGAREARGPFLRQHPLLPVIQNDVYARHTFSQRLSLELQSLGLVRQEVGVMDDEIPFQREIQDDLKLLRKETLKDLKVLQEKITREINSYRERERRAEEDTNRAAGYLSYSGG